MSSLEGARRLRLGDLEVCRLGFGAMQLPGRHAFGEPSDPERARAVLRRFVELGGNLIDTAWYYGPHVAHRLIAEALHPYPSHLVIATKLGGRRTPAGGWAAALEPEQLRQGCEEDLRGLRVERLDVVHLRWMEGAGVEFELALDAMLGLKRAGKIRHLALSNVTVQQLETALQQTPIVAVQNLYNVLATGSALGFIPNAVVSGAEEMVDFCAARSIAFLPFFPLKLPGRGVDSPTLQRISSAHGVTAAQVALAWLLARSPTLLPIPGTSSIAHLEENWGALDVRLTPEESSAIAQARIGAA